jgi:hypothetical protein
MQGRAGRCGRIVGRTVTDIGQKGHAWRTWQSRDAGNAEQSREVCRHSGQNRHACWAEEAFMQGSASRHVKAGRSGRPAGYRIQAGRPEQVEQSRQIGRQSGNRQGVRLESQAGMHAEQGMQSGRAGQIRQVRGGR